MASSSDKHTDEITYMVHAELLDPLHTQQSHASFRLSFEDYIIRQHGAIESWTHPSPACI
jgi:hypothetical protein